VNDEHIHVNQNPFCGYIVFVTIMVNGDLVEFVYIGEGITKYVNFHFPGREHIEVKSRYIVICGKKLLYSLMQVYVYQIHHEGLELPKPRIEVFGFHTAIQACLFERETIRDYLLKKRNLINMEIKSWKFTGEPASGHSRIDELVNRNISVYQRIGGLTAAIGHKENTVDQFLKLVSGGLRLEGNFKRLNGELMREHQKLSKEERRAKPRKTVNGHTPLYKRLSFFRLQGLNSKALYKLKVVDKLDNGGGVYLFESLDNGLTWEVPKRSMGRIDELLEYMFEIVLGTLTVHE
jgi:hypothetical protein